MAQFRASIEYLRNKSETNLLIVILFLSFGLGVIYDCSRVIIFATFGTFNENIDTNGFGMKVFLILLAFSIIIRIIIKYSEISGHKTEKDLQIRIFYVLAMILFSVLNIFTFYPTIFYEESGFFVYNVNFILGLHIYGIYIALFIFIMRRSKIILNEIKNEEVKKHVVIPLISIGTLTFERSFSIGYLSPIIESYYIIIIDYLLLTLILFFLCLFIFKYPDTMEVISTYFSIKSVYLVRSNGSLIYEFDFQKEIPKYPFSPKRLILAGFVYAVSQGFKTVLEFDSEIDTINFGKETLLFKHGKYLFGVLYITETSPSIVKKLTRFIRQFEDYYDKELKEWKGSLSFLEHDKIKNWIYKCFR